MKACRYVVDDDGGGGGGGGSGVLYAGHAATAAHTL